MVFLLSDGENVSMMVGNFILDFFKEARLGSMIKIPKLGLGSGSTLEARARLGLEKYGLVFGSSSSARARKIWARSTPKKYLMFNKYMRPCFCLSLKNSCVMMP